MSLAGETLGFLDWEKAKDDIVYFAVCYGPLLDSGFKLIQPQQEILEAVQRGDYQIIAIACRKGGKTIIVALAITWLAAFKDCRVVVNSGSYDQAKELYDYVYQLCTKIPEMHTLLTKEPMMSETRFKSGAKIHCLTASEKRARSPTADVNVLDEFPLIKQHLWQSSWAITRAGRYGTKRIVLGTVTDIPGADSLDYFLDFYDRADELGFTRFLWDDSVCPWIDTTDTRFSQMILPEEVFRADFKAIRSLRRGLVFPGFPGQVRIISEAEYAKLYRRGNPSVGGIDWGFVHPTVISIGQKLLGGDFLINHIEEYKETDDLALVQIVKDLQAKMLVERWYADSAGVFQIGLFRRLGIPTTARVFSKLKEPMIGVVKAILSSGHFLMPDPAWRPEFQPLYDQMRRYHRDDKGKPVKRFDDYVDSILCLCSNLRPFGDPTRSPLELGGQERVFVPDMERIDWSQVEDWSDLEGREPKWGIKQ